MKNAKPIIIATIIVLTLGTVGFIVYKKRKEKENVVTPPEVGDKEKSPINLGTITNVFPLRNGSRGLEVTSLQKWLNINLKIKKLPEIKVDGIFGTETESALKTITTKTTMEKSYFDNAKIANA
jgi:peptidoglycan hydrolase-like protein with peptidoglycan-binding domain